VNGRPGLLDVVVERDLPAVEPRERARLLGREPQDSQTPGSASWGEATDGPQHPGSVADTDVHDATQRTALRSVMAAGIVLVGQFEVSNGVAEGSSALA
jgi:hypothetical protein